jgi:shikimate kinase
MSRQAPLNVILIGFMGCGKTTLGCRLGALLGFEFVDTDQLIVEQGGRSIPEIFAAEGESGFRQRETAALESLKGRDHLIIATGGGIVTQERNLPILRALGVIVYVTTSDQSLWNRVRRNKERPMLHTANPRRTFQELLNARRPLYQGCADLTLDTRGLSPAEAAYGIAETIRVFFAHKAEG